MTVKALRQMLSPDDDELLVLVFVSLPDADVEYIPIRGVRRTLDPDTAEDVIALECGQED